MHDGFIKVAASSPEIKVADTDFNANSIISCINEADEYGVKLLCFPELCVTGSTCGDLFFSRVLHDGAINTLEKIRSISRNLEMLIIAGSPVRHNNKLYNCAVFISKGEYLGAAPLKITQDKSRWFASYNGENTDSPFGIFGNKFMLQSTALCEFSVGLDIGPLASIIVKPAAENETAGKAARRRSFLNAESERVTAGFIYAGAGAGESTTDFTFAGHRIIAENGVILAESGLFETAPKNRLTVSEIDVMLIADERCFKKAFTETADKNPVQIVKFDVLTNETILTRKISKTPFIPDNSEYNEYRETILSIQANGLKKRVCHTGANKLVIGVSGGRDSALALAVCTKTMDLLDRPHTDIIGISMPCFGTTERTKSAAASLCNALGVTFKEIDIGNAVEVHLNDIEHDINNHNTTYENSQARERTQVLMDYANDVNGIVAGTGDLSELMLGWATYNGDHMAMYSVNSGVPKTLISDLLFYFADNYVDTKKSALKSAIHDILDTPISPELLPADSGKILQITEDIVGPYVLHDFFIYYYFKGYSPKKILRLALYAFGGEYTHGIILKWLKNFYTRFFMGQFKRSCSPDGVAPICVSISPRGGLIMPSDAIKELWLSELSELSYTNNHLK